MTTCTALEAPSPLSSTPAWHCTCAHQRKSQDPLNVPRVPPRSQAGQQPGSLEQPFTRCRLVLEGKVSTGSTTRAPTHL